MPYRVRDEGALRAQIRDEATLRVERAPASPLSGFRNGDAI
jgi:hypothetical protein